MNWIVFHPLYPPTRFGVHSLLFLCSIQNLSQNPKSKIPKLQNPKSKIPKIQNPKSKIPKIQNPQNPQNPKSPEFGALGASHKELLHNGPKSKIQNPQNRPKKFGFWILDWGFWILDLGDFGFWGFWCFWGGPGDVPRGNLVTVLGGQRLESPLVRLSGTVQNQLYLI